MEVARKAIAEKLSPDQLRRFDERANATDYQVQHQTLNHLMEQKKAYAKTTLDNSFLIAQADVAANPLNETAFITNQGTLFSQADAYLKSIGSDNAKANDIYKSQLNDGLWKSRVDGLTSAGEWIAADDLLRRNDNSGQINNPVMREKLMHDVERGATAMRSGIFADKNIKEEIAKALVRKAEPERATPESGPAAGAPLSVNLPLVKLAIIKAEGSGSEATSIQGARGSRQIPRQHSTPTKSPASHLMLKRIA
jgi:hypothetical protein